MVNNKSFSFVICKKVKVESLELKEWDELINLSYKTITQKLTSSAIVQFWKIFYQAQLVMLLDLKTFSVFCSKSKSIIFVKIKTTYKFNLI